LKEIYHFEKVYLDRFEHILRELGERDWERRDLLYYYKVSSLLTVSLCLILSGPLPQLFAQTDDELVGYRRFMDLVCHLKIERMNQSFWSLESEEMFQDKNKDRRVPKKTAKQQDYFIGEWFPAPLFNITLTCCR
jgi:hypothetical protein